jgi:hypothetical protein
MVVAVVAVVKRCFVSCQVEDRVDFCAVFVATFVDVDSIMMIASLIRWMD